MVIGNGVIASRFIDYRLQSECLIFAGSINDSVVNDDKVIKEEEEAVIKALDSKYNIFVYFSSCSIVDEGLINLPYVQHKVRMEELIKRKAVNYLIVRLPQVTGLNDNKSSLVNYLFDAILNKKNFDLWINAKKNIIDIDDVYEIVDCVLKRKIHINKTINVASPVQSTVSEMVASIEKFTGHLAQYNSVNKGSCYAIDISDINDILNELKIDFGEEYLFKSLCKYYSYLIESPKLLSVIVPTYNEEHGIEEFYRRTKNVLMQLMPRFNHEIIFVNDYSTDNTLQKIEKLSKDDSTVKVINFSKNFGNQIGITAGIDFSSGDIAIIIDDDLQDPPEIILNFISKWDNGYKVVYGIRPKRDGVNFIFKFTAKLYYRVIGFLSDTEIPNDTGDFRLIDRVVIDALKKIKEENRYYRGLVAWVGFQQTGVVYQRDKRFAGASTFSFKKYVNFALNGLTSFTEKPLYFSSLIGALITSVTFVLAVILIIGKIIDPSVSIRGWTSLSVITLFFGGVQLLSVGVLGIYISKIYREVKARPLYIIESTKNIEI
jgi:glycosyltransferase involved in cell wall biosynthesis